MSSVAQKNNDLPNDVVLSARNVSKKFCRSLKRSMWYGLQDLGRDVFGVEGSGSSETPELPELRRDEFWALRNINFELRRGEIRGIIGRNGCGKSTLLRVLSGIFPPDRGTVLYRDRVTSLIALGAGFHPHLTGRENVYLNGTILGMTRREIQAKFEQITEFAEVGDFMEAPIAVYSSGMKVRLGFSVAVHLDPSILFVDEVLAVGDQAFKRKAQGRILDLLTTGVSVLFVSHNLAQVARLCPTTMFLEDGEIVECGDSDTVIGNYLMKSGQNKEPEPDSLPSEALMKKAQNSNPELGVLHSVSVTCGDTNTETREVRCHETVTVQLTFEAKSYLDEFRITLALCDMEGADISSFTSENLIPSLAIGSWQLECVLPNIPLRRGEYWLQLFIRDRSGMFHYDPQLVKLRATPPNLNAENISDKSLIWLESHWGVSSVDEDSLST